MRISILILLFSLQAKCQDNIDKKYIVALLYLKSDKTINHQINQTFYYLDTSAGLPEYKVNDEIWFLPFSSLEFGLKENNWGIDTSLINNNKLFKEEFYFEHYKTPLISKLIPQTSSKLLLTFSKPFGNYLLAEMLDTGLHASNTFKTGRAIKFLIIFDESGLIKTVLNNITQYR